jgi:hypothetical protein
LDAEEFEACKVALLMDNCLNHISNDVIAILTREQVRIVTFATHTTHIFQILDMVLFGALKKHAMDVETLEEESRAVEFILKVYRDFRQTMIEVNI